ncbi:MAG: hypothetical protein ACKOEM_18810 [Planctomycetia bacterium]
MRAEIGSIVAGLALAAAAGGAAEPPPDRLGLQAPWQVERVTLVDGRTLEGLVLEDERDDVLFVEVVRRPGRPMYLVTRRLPARSIASIDRLPDAEHGMLAARVEAFRTSDRDQRETSSAIPLVRRGEEGPWCYTGPWFTIESSASQALTRQAIVRLESLLDAFAGLVPTASPAATDRRLDVRLCGSQADYARTQATVGMKAANPAFYLPQRGLLVAGGDVTPLLEQAQLAADGLDATIARQRALDADVAAGLRDLATTLERQGIPASQRAEIIAGTRARWQREKAATLAQVEQARKDNAALVERARREFFTALAHEAWHAYADLRLDGGRLPAWLDEGLAQVFEAGLLEAGQLRLDAPDPQRLATLGSLLETTREPLLAVLVTDSERQFVVGHGTPAATSRRAYLLAWGVAYDLVLGAPVLSARSLAAATEGGGELARFEKLVGMPLADYEATWRTRMLALTRRPRAPTPPGAPAAARPLPGSDAGAPAAPDR